MKIFFSRSTLSFNSCYAYVLSKFAFLCLQVSIIFLRATRWFAVSAVGILLCYNFHLVFNFSSNYVGQLSKMIIEINRSFINSMVFIVNGFICKCAALTRKWKWNKKQNFAAKEKEEGVEVKQYQNYLKHDTAYVKDALCNLFSSSSQFHLTFSWIWQHITRNLNRTAGTFSDFLYFWTSFTCQMRINKNIWEKYPKTNWKPHVNGINLNNNK